MSVRTFYRKWMRRFGLKGRGVQISDVAQAAIDAMTEEDKERLAYFLHQLRWADNPPGVSLREQPQMCPHRSGHPTDVEDGICIWCLRSVEEVVSE